MRIRRVKSIFTRSWREHSTAEETITESRHRKGERGIWQRRFWEHACRDEDDLKRCLDYLHINPLKHGLVERVKDWPWSSFHRYVKMGNYPEDWGNSNHWYGDEFKHAE
jgi:putative transposase